MKTFTGIAAVPFHVSNTSSAFIAFDITDTQHGNYAM